MRFLLSTKGAERPSLGCLLAIKNLEYPYVTALEIPPVVSPKKAVQAAIVSGNQK
jgi:hypothetical protein